MADAEDDYILARFAEWAGDTPFMLRCLERLPEPDQRERRVTVRPTKGKKGRKKHVETRERPFAGAEDVIRSSGVAIRETIRDSLRRTEISPERLLAEKTETRSDPEAEPMSPILETACLRGVVRPLSDREFELKAYLAVLDLEDEFFQRVDAAVARFGDPKRGRARHMKKEGDKPDRGGDWVMTGDVLCLVSVDDFGLIYAKGFWVKPELPDDLRPAFNAFYEVLRVLDPRLG